MQTYSDAHMDFICCASRVFLQLIWQTLLFKVTYSVFPGNQTLELGLLAPCIPDELHKHLFSTQCINNGLFFLFYTAVLIKTSLFPNLFAQKTSLLHLQYLPTVFHFGLFMIGFGRGFWSHFSTFYTITLPFKSLGSVHFFKIIIMKGSSKLIKSDSKMCLFEMNAVLLNFLLIEKSGSRFSQK